MNFNAKQSQVANRQLLVQTLSIPFLVTANSTPSAVLVTSDEPALLFFKTTGTDQITPELAAGETATYSIGPSDSTGVRRQMLACLDTFGRKSWAPILHE